MQKGSCRGLLCKQRGSCSIASCGSKHCKPSKFLGLGPSWGLKSLEVGLVNKRKLQHCFLFKQPLQVFKNFGLKPSWGPRSPKIASMLGPSDLQDSFHVGSF